MTYDLGFDVRLCSVCRHFDIRKLQWQVRKASRENTILKTTYLDNFIGGEAELLELGLYYRQHENMRDLLAARAVCDLCTEIWRCFTSLAAIPEGAVLHEIKNGACAAPLLLLYTRALWHGDGVPKIIVLQETGAGSHRTVAYLDVCVGAGELVCGSLGDDPDYPIGRLLHISSGSAACLDMARSWLRHCQMSKSHEHCRTWAQCAPLPTRIINIDRYPHLEDGGGRIEPYLALSYCWGGETAAQLKAGNITDYRKQLPPEAMPATIADAITTARALGIRYVWVDALCIIQDDNDDWMAEAARMRDVYRNSTITVCASDQVKVSDGLFRDRRYEAVKVPWYGNCRLFPEYVYLRESGHMDLADFGSSSRGLNTRGWCLQELLLAPRTLWLGERQMEMMCYRAVYREGIVGAVRTDVARPAQRAYANKDRLARLRVEEMKWLKSSHYRALGLPLTIRLPYLTIDFDTLRRTHDLATSLRRRTLCQPIPPSLVVDSFIKLTAYDYWREIVSQYTTRQFSHPEDVLVALSGLADAFSQALGETYFAGHWKGDLVYSLAWALEPRELDMAGFEELRAQHKAVGYLAPSWSWASIISGRISFYPSAGNRIDRSMRRQRALYTASLVHVHAEPLTSNVYGPIKGAYLQLRAHFVEVPDLLIEPVEGQSIYALRHWIWRQVCGGVDLATLHSSGIEFILKHKCHRGQRYVLLRLGQYQQLREAARNSASPVITTQILLLETCEATADTWRRVMCHETHDYGGPLTKEFNDEVLAIDWQTATFCIV